MTGIVYGSTLERAYKKIEKIKEDYEKCGIKVDYSRGASRILKYEIRYVFKNGDKWLAVKASEGVRGLACNVAYIDRDIEDQLITYIILPTVKAMPFQATHFY